MERYNLILEMYAFAGKKEVDKYLHWGTEQLKSLFREWKTLKNK